MGNDQVRFELTYYALEPKIRVIAPWREWNLRSRTDLIRYAESYSIPIPVTQEKPYSSDRNLMHVSFEGGILEDPEKEPPEDMFIMTVSPQRAPDSPQEVSIEFDSGVPVGVDGKRRKPHEILAYLNEIGGKHGIGRADVVENRYVGMKSRGVYETPGGTILFHGHKHLESITLDREVMHLRDSLVTRFSELIYNGYWFSPEMDAVRALVEQTQGDVTGSVRLKLYKGNVIVCGRRSPNSLYRADYATFEEEEVYDQKDAEGFIKINSLRLKIRKS